MDLLRGTRSQDEHESDGKLQPEGRYGPSRGPVRGISRIAAVASRAGTGIIVDLILAVLKAKIKIKNPRIRAGIGPKPTISVGKWQPGPSPGTPRAKEKIKNHFEHSQVVALKLKMNMLILLLAVLGRFPAKLGPRTRSNGKARKCVWNAPKSTPVDQL